MGMSMGTGTGMAGHAMLTLTVKITYEGVKTKWTRGFFFS